jgi:hypothetical protein
MRWVLNDSNPGGPVAVYGPPVPTMGDAGLSCLRGRNALNVFILSETPMASGKTILVEAKGRTLPVQERFEDDAVGIAHFEIPLESAVATEIAANARELHFRLPDREMRLPLGKAAWRVARDCLSRR